MGAWQDSLTPVTITKTGLGGSMCCRERELKLGLIPAGISLRGETSTHCEED